VEEAAQAYAGAYLRQHGGPPAPSVAEQFRQQEEEGDKEIDLEPFRSERCSSGYRGVYWNVSNQKYHAAIKVNGTLQYLGLFDAEEEAVQAYARAYHRQYNPHR